MSEQELKSCPCCNGKAEKLNDGLGIPISFPSLPAHIAVRCSECGFMVLRVTMPEAIAAWNKRFVCPDKCGKPVYAGDEVKGIWQVDKKTEVWGKMKYYDEYGLYAIEGVNGNMFSAVWDSIELVQGDRQEVCPRNNDTQNDVYDGRIHGMRP